MISIVSFYGFLRGFYGGLIDFCVISMVCFHWCLYDFYRYKSISVRCVVLLLISVFYIVSMISLWFLLLAHWFLCDFYGCVVDFCVMSMIVYWFLYAIVLRSLLYDFCRFLHWFLCGFYGLLIDFCVISIVFDWFQYDFYGCCIGICMISIGLDWFLYGFYCFFIDFCLISMDVL